MSSEQACILTINGVSSSLKFALYRANEVPTRLAFELFCYQVKKWIGAFTAALGGLDTLVFTGGIGENAPVIRICEGMEFWELNLMKNKTRQMPRGFL